MIFIILILNMIIFIFIFFFMIFYYYRVCILQGINILIFIYDGYNLIKKINIDHISNKDINNFKKSIERGGVFPIKLVQWGLSRFKIICKNTENNVILKELDNFYESCPFHSDDYTKIKFKEQFHYDIEDKYSIIRIASGSIAQVYKLRDNNTGELYAMKITHPNIKQQINVSKFIFDCMLYLNKYFYKKSLNFDTSNFFNSIEKQINLINEVKNCQHFYRKYKDNKYIVIPKIIDYSTDIIIMTYEEGKYYDDTNIGDYKKSKIISLLEIFLMNTMIMDYFIHADLHKGNWKIRKMNDTNDYQIVIYDFGLCLDVNKFRVREFYSSIINNNKKKLVDVLCDGITNINEIENCKEKILSSVNENIDLRYMDMNNIIRVIIDLCYKLNIILDSDYLTFLLLIINFQSISSDYSHSGGASCDYDIIQEDFVKKSSYPYIIDFCKHTNSFNELKLYLIQFLKTHASNGNLYNDINKRVKINKNIKISDSDSDTNSDW